MFHINDYATGVELKTCIFYMIAVMEARDLRNLTESAIEIRDDNGKRMFVCYSDGTETYCPEEDDLSPFENDYFNDDENY